MEKSPKDPLPGPNKHSLPPMQSKIVISHPQLVIVWENRRSACTTMRGREEWLWMKLPGNVFWGQGGLACPSTPILNFSYPSSIMRLGPWVSFPLDIKQ